MQKQPINWSKSTNPIPFGGGHLISGRCMVNFIWDHVAPPPEAVSNDVMSLMFRASAKDLNQVT